MTLNWTDITLQTDGLEKTPCDCCGATTIEYRGDLHHKDDWIAFYWVRLSEGHPEALPIFHIGTGNWAEGSKKDERRIFGSEYNPESEGFRIMDLSKESDLAIWLDRKDVVDTDFAQSAFAMLDAIFMRDERLKDLHP